MRTAILTHTRNLVCIMFGAILMGVGLHTFSMPYHLAEGGFTGIGLIIHYITGWKLSQLIFVLNILPLIVAFKWLDRRAFWYSICGIASVSLTLEITRGLENFLHFDNDLFLAAMYAGGFIGIGCGIIFRVGGTTGGLDIIAQLLYRKVGISIGQTILVWDFFVLLLSMWFTSPKLGMYTLLEMIIVSRIIDFIVEGASSCRIATIISQTAPAIQRAWAQQSSRGATILQGKGGYTGETKEILYLALSPRELPRLKELVRSVDPKAFVVIHNARDVMGEGFTFKKDG